MHPRPDRGRLRDLRRQRIARQGQPARPGHPPEHHQRHRLVRAGRGRAVWRPGSGAARDPQGAQARRPVHQAGRRLDRPDPRALAGTLPAPVRHGRGDRCRAAGQRPAALAGGRAARGCRPGRRGARVLRKARAPERLSSHRTPAGAGGVPRRAAPVPEVRPGLAALPARVRLRRHPGRRHGTGENGPGAGLPASATGVPFGDRAGRGQEGGAAGRPQKPAHQLAARIGAVYPGPAHPGIYGACARQEHRHLRRIRPRPDHLRHHAARYRHLARLPLPLRHPGRVAGHQEPALQERQGRPPAGRRAAPVHDRHAGGEQHLRAVVAVRLPQPRPAREAWTTSSAPSSTRSRAKGTRARRTCSDGWSTRSSCAGRKIRLLPSCRPAPSG